jgi:cholinesterase
MYEASGLMAQARADHGDGVIFVAINYRLGLFGWLNGNGDEDVFPNVGLQDQLFALHWYVLFLNSNGRGARKADKGYRIQKYISLFGGDAENVTVMGQSAGAGSITHHLTAVNDDGVVPFHRAIIQSPGWEHGDSVKIWQTTLSTASFLTGHPQTSGKNLVDMDFATLNQINGQVVFGSSNGSFTFGPTPDGGYVPDFAESQLLQGHFDSRPKLMIGHNSNEAGLFVPTELDTEEELISGLTNFLEELYPEAVEYVLNELYPSPSDATSYSTQSERAMLIVSESSFACNTRYLAIAFGNSTMNYRFQMPPGIHGQDLPYTFFHENTTETDVPIPGLAEAMQAYFTSFAKSGNVNLADEILNLLDWPEYGDTANIVTFGLDGIGIAEDDTRNHRCDFWQKGNSWKH